MNEDISMTNGDGRRSDLDWLRVIATIGVFLLHCLKFFDPLDWEVKNNVLSAVVLFPILFLIQWLMPLFVVLSGASIFLALRRKGTAAFLRSRLLRLLLPYLTVGMVLIIPPQEYVRYVSHGASPPEGTIALLSLYLQEMEVLGSGYPWLVPPQMHLWYLLWLFVFTMLLVPFLVLARRFAPRAAPLAARTRPFLERPGALFLLCLPLAAVLTPLDPSRPIGNLASYGGWPLLVYPLFLVLGYCIVAIKGFEDALVRHRRTALLLALLTLPLFSAAALAMLGGTGFRFGTAGFAGLSLLRAFNAWALLIALLGYGISSLHVSNRFLKYASEATLPFYMIHQTVIVLIGYAIAADPTPWGAKLLFLVVLAFLATTVIYDLLVRRANIVRFLFGMKRRDAARPAAAAAAAVIALYVMLSPAAARAAEGPGFSGRIEAGPAVFGVSDHLSTDDAAYLDSLDTEPHREDKVRSAIFFQVRYRTEAGREVYFGIPYDTSELPLEAGLDLPLDKAGDLKFNTMYIKDYTWRDPYLAGSERESSEYVREIASVTYDRIYGSSLSVTYRVERFDVKNDDLGLRIPDLRRDSIGHELNLAYAFSPADGVTIAPVAGVGRTTAEGDANNANSIMIGVDITRSSGDATIHFTIDATRSACEQPHPLFGKTITSLEGRVLLVWTQGRLFGSEHLFSNIFAGSEPRWTHEAFLDRRKVYSGVTIGYRF